MATNVTANAHNSPKANESYFKLFQGNLTSWIIISVALIMKHPRDYWGSGKGQKVLYNHDTQSTVLIGIFNSILLMPKMHLVTFKLT